MPYIGGGYVSFPILNSSALLYSRSILSLLILLLCLCANTLAAQAEVLRTVKNEPIELTFLSEYEPYISQSSTNGTVTLVESPRYNYTLTYTPDLDFVGLDEFLLVSFPFGFNVRFTPYQIEVREADVRARHDQAVATAGQPVSIDVLSNDYSNVGSLTLTSVPVTNAGTATITNGQVTFTPAADFGGLTDLNYVVCTDNGVCDLGTVTVNVQPAAGTLDDTVRVFTIKNHPQFVFAEANAVPAAAPDNGRIVDSNGIMAYLPDENFTGSEVVTYTNPTTGHRTTFDITVLDVERNAFATEDRAYTPVGAEVTLNVLHNDVYSIFADCVTFGTPRYGSVTASALRGEVTYTPPAGWSGVDRFTYTSKAPGCNGPAEEATVYVFVSDFAPARETRHLTLPAGSTVPVNYEVPNGEVTWSAQTQPLYGQLTTNATTGDLLYTPNANAAGRTDRFRVGYCLNPRPDGSCASASVTNVTVSIGSATSTADCAEQDCVWPGDTNRDGVVDVGDLLPIGYAMGESGTPRLAASPNAWSGQYAEDWGRDLNGVDLKHIDANGDQIISALDTQVVMANLGRSYRLRPEQQNFTTFDLSLIGPASVEPGDMVELKIVAGNSQIIVEDIYGFRFAFTYDNEAVEPNSLNVDFVEDGWISYASPIAALSSNNPDAGIIETAVTRTSGESISGFGEIGTMTGIIVEDIYGFLDGPEAGTGDEFIDIEFGGLEGLAMTGAGYGDAIHVNPARVRVTRTEPTDLSVSTAEDVRAFLNDKLKTFPNPATEQLTVHLNGQQRFQELQLTDMTGRRVLELRGLNANHQVLNLTQLGTGAYTLTLVTNAGVVNRLIQVR